MLVILELEVDFELVWDFVICVFSELEDDIDWEKFWILFVLFKWVSMFE